MLTDARQSLELRCSGINTAGGPETPVVTDHTYNNRSVRVVWTTSPHVGELEAPMWGHVQYHSPPRVTGAQADLEVRATMSVGALGATGAETITHTSQIHVINRRMRLDVHAGANAQCAFPASPSAGFDVQCDQHIDLEIGDDFSVSSGNGSSCGRGAWSRVQGCMGAQAEPPQATWSLDAVVGRADPDNGILDLRITGNRVGYPAVTVNGRTEQPHTNPLFSRPLAMSGNDGESRGFGSPTTTAHAGGYTAFELHAR